MTRSPISIKLAACLIALAAFGCNSEPEPGPAVSATFEIDSSDIARVEWTVSGGGLVTPITGLADVTGGATPTVAVTIMDLPVATGYGIEIIAYDATDTNICRGTGVFDIVEGATTNINVPVVCSISSTLPSGSVGIDVTFQDNICPIINSINVVPQTIAVGQTAQVSVNAQDPELGTLTYDWTSLAGTFADPTAAATTYTCTQPINHNVDILVSDGDSFCDQSRLLNVTCVPDVCAGTPPLDCDDANQCTDDGVCDPVTGCPGSTDSSAGTACDFIAVGDGFCDGAGTCVECLVGSDCTDDGNECTDPATCTLNVCGVTNTPADTPCTGGICDGLGSCVGCLVSGDCADDANQCTSAPFCNAGTCDPQTPLSAGAVCDFIAVGDGVCNGAGTCVECVDAGQCTDDGNECTTGASCTAGTCDTATPLASGTTCSVGVCDGAGACVGCITAGDCPDDANQCTTPATCTLNVCDPQTPLTVGTACDFVAVGDGFCDGSGTCAECLAAGDCPDDGNQCTSAPSCTTNACDPQDPLPAGTPCDNGGGPGSGSCSLGTCF